MSTHLVSSAIAPAVIRVCWRLLRQPEGVAAGEPNWTLTFTPNLTPAEVTTFAAIQFEAQAPDRLAALAAKLLPTGVLLPEVVPPPLPVLVTKLNPDGSIADPAVITPVLPAILPLVIPPGLIAMWPGTIATIPAGWRHCDGTNGTPDLRGKFVKGASVAPLGTGGSSTHTHAAHTGVISHVHPLISKITATGVGLNYELGTADASSTGGTEGISTAAPNGAVASLTHDSPSNEPPWVALLYIMKA